MLKKCVSCKIEKEEWEFSLDRSKKDGLQSKCKPCAAIYKKSRSAEISTHTKKYKSNRKEVISKASKTYYLKNKEKLCTYASIYYENNKSRRLNQQHRYSKSLKGKAVHRNASHKRRLKISKGDVTTTQLLELLSISKNCFWCGVPLSSVAVHIDHYYPLSKGGTHTISNLVISCAKCNTRKGAKDPIEFAMYLIKKGF